MAAVRYIGAGFIPHIPARDLSAQEVKVIGIQRLLDSGLYEEVRSRKHKKADDIEMAPEIQENLDGASEEG